MHTATVLDFWPFTATDRQMLRYKLHLIAFGPATNGKETYCVHVHHERVSDTFKQVLVIISFQSGAWKHLIVDFVQVDR